MSKIIRFRKPTTADEVDASLSRANIDYGFANKGTEEAENISKEMVNLADTKRKLAEAKKLEAESKSTWISVGVMGALTVFHVLWEGHGRILPRKVEEFERIISSKIFRK